MSREGRRRTARPMLRTIATRASAEVARHADQNLTALYLDMMAAERGAGTNTLAAYGRDLEDFSAYLKGAGRSIARADTDDLRAYLGALSRRGLGAATQARRLSAIRQLYRFLYAEGHRSDDPAAVNRFVQLVSDTVTPMARVKTHAVGKFVHGTLAYPVDSAIAGNP